MNRLNRQWLPTILFSISLCAYTTDTTVAARSSQKPHNNFRDKWAVVVGVEKFQDQSWNFKYGIKDATDFSNYLLKDAKFPTDHVRLLTGNNATKSSLSEALFSWLPTVAKPQDLVLVYIRSRGTFPTVTNGELTYMAASDTDPNHLNDTAFEMTAFPRNVLDKIHGAATIIIADTDLVA